MAMTVEGFKPSQFQGVPRLWRVRRPDAESAGHYGSALDHYRQEHKSSDELPSNSETVEPGLTDEKLKGFVGGNTQRDSEIDNGKRIVVIENENKI
uniref:Uncharacterized protein n=1 Tax=Oryza meridionalis TaxID=40149 RepID=A0A0E0E9B9_9ORYZ